MKVVACFSFAILLLTSIASMDIAPSKEKKEDLLVLSTLTTLLQEFAAPTVNPKFKESVLVIVEKLFKSDYQIKSYEQNVCSSYPPKILVAAAIELPPHGELPYYARARNRFPVPVLTLANGKSVYRSGALSTRLSCTYANLSSGPISLSFLQGQRAADSLLLGKLSITHIADLMTNPTFDAAGVSITRSETWSLLTQPKLTDYTKMTILSLPTPGCEFFTEYAKNGLDANGMRYFVEGGRDPKCFTQPNISSGLGIDWYGYTQWDITATVANYLKVILSTLADPNPNSSSVLVHCISGWDRTPMMISLIRLSLWADGMAHISLSASEILYLTLGYDWMAFGHQLSSRLKSNEPIIHFTFNMLDALIGDEFSFDFLANEVNINVIPVVSMAQPVIPIPPPSTSQVTSAGSGWGSWLPFAFFRNSATDAELEELELILEPQEILQFEKDVSEIEAAEEIQPIQLQKSEEVTTIEVQQNKGEEVNRQFSLKAAEQNERAKKLLEVKQLFLKIWKMANLFPKN